MSHKLPKLIVGRPEPVEHVTFTRAECAKLDAYLDRVDQPNWRQMLWWL